MAEVNQGNEGELEIIRAIAESGDDKPVLMLNLNRYVEKAGFPHGELYTGYMAALQRLLPEVGGKILWQHPVLGQPIGEQALDEALAAWYPSHQAFLDLRHAPGSEENFRLRASAVEYAVIHRFSGEVEPFTPK